MKRNLFIPILLVMVVMGPIVAASITYFYRDQLDFNCKSYGQLINPVHIAFKQLYNTKLETINARCKKWHMIYIAPKACGSACKEQIRLLNNAHLSLHKYSKKITAAVAYNNDINIDIKAHSIIVVDPMSNYVLRYSEDINPVNVKKIVNDLKKLLYYLK